MVVPFGPRDRSIRGHKAVVIGGRHERPLPDAGPGPDRLPAASRAGGFNCGLLAIEIDPAAGWGEEGFSSLPKTPWSSCCR
jgi:hypothetical protein